MEVRIDVMTPEAMQTELEQKQFVDNAYSLFKEFYTNPEQQAFRLKCVENEEYWKANTWANKKKPVDGEPQPVTPVLFSTVENLLADIMDNYPDSVIRGEEPNDDQTAAELSQIVKYIIKKRKYRKTYRTDIRRMLKRSAGVLQVYWDKSLLNGLGDINIIDWDIRNFAWDPDCNDIQDGRAVFKFTWYKKDWLKMHYPAQYENMSDDEWKRDKYKNEADNQESNEILGFEYYYKKYDPETQASKVYMAYIIGHVLIFNTEQMQPDGIIESGKYPFIINCVYPLEDTIVGMSIIDIYKSLQDYIDKLDQIVIENALVSGKLRFIENAAAGIPDDDLLDYNKPIVKGSNVSEEYIRPFQAQSLNPAVYTHLNTKMSILKEESGQNQFNRGEGGSGVTAAAAIKALQEAGAKRSRTIIDELYDNHQLLVELIIDFINQYYTETRVFRIRGQGSQPDQNISFDNSKLKYQIDDTGNVMTDKAGTPLKKYREFDIDISAQKQSPYNSMYQNEVAEELKKLGITNEIETLQVMDFDGKETVLDSVKSRLDLQAKYDQLMQQYQTLMEQVNAQQSELQAKNDKQGQYIKQLEGSNEKLRTANTNQNTQNQINQLTNTVKGIK